MNSLGNGFGAFASLFVVRCGKASWIQKFRRFCIVIYPWLLMSGGCWLYNTVFRKTSRIIDNLISQTPRPSISMTVFYCKKLCQCPDCRAFLPWKRHRNLDQLSIKQIWINLTYVKALGLRVGWVLWYQGGFFMCGGRAKKSRVMFRSVSKPGAR